MLGRVEEMRVGVEGHARARVGEDAADLNDVKADVDDQVAGEGMAQIVKAHSAPVLVETGVGGGAAEHAFGDVVMQKRRAVRTREHVIGTAREVRTAFVLTENGGELGEKRNLANGSARLRRDPVRRHPAAAPRKLMTNVNDAGNEVDVLPAQPEHFRETHTRVRAGEKQRPIPARTSSKEPGELCAGEDTLV